MATCNGGRTMGLDYGLDREDTHWKRKFRWLFKLRGISADDGSDPIAINSLPPRRGSRPSLGWKEFEVQHVTESIWYPFKPDWKPINIVLYDIRCNCNPVFEWIRQNERRSGAGVYDPEQRNNNWKPVVDGELKRDSEIVLYDGCGKEVEKWKLENCYPSSIEWGELDMDSSDLVVVEIQLRYDRAYVTNKCPSGGGNAIGARGGNNSGTASLSLVEGPEANLR